MLIAGIYIFNKYKPVYDELSLNANKKIAVINDYTFKDKTKSIIYDNKGNIIKKLSLHDYYYIPYEEIQPNIVDALISIEDIRYFEHEGYDKKAIARAAYALVKNKGRITQGGSTITQQLVKLQFLTLDKSYMRKAEEVLIAVELEKRFSKEKILEFYLNNVNYGNGTYGIESASRYYFNKKSSELTLSEIAFLTAIPNNPTYYNPVRNFENTISRKNLILSKMLEYGKISESVYKDSKNQEIKLNIVEKEVEPDSYAVSFILSSATKELMRQQGFQFKYWFTNEQERKAYWEEYNDLFMQLNKKIRNGGFKIYSTIDVEKQVELQKSLNKGLKNYREIDSQNKLYKMQGSAVTIDNKTGDLVAIIGGRTQDDVDNTFNRAFLSYRQPGSTIKPLLAYIPAFEREMLDTTEMEDSKIEEGPENAGKSYRGNMELREAIERSVNTIPYKLVDEFKPKTVLNYLVNMEFANIVPSDNNLAISIGGFTYGSNTLEMASAYSTIARNGEFIKPTGIEKITDLTETVVYENKRTKKRIYDSGASYLMTDVLKGVLTEPHATGRGLALENIESAGKTGTTNDYKDVWFVGYTPYYTTAVWAGKDKPERIYNASSSKITGEIWKDYMTKIHKNLQPAQFEMPERISYMYVNPKNGEISKNEINGWIKQLVPEINFETQEKRKAEELEKIEMERRIAEEKRKEQERIRAEKRLKAIQESGLTEDFVNSQYEDARLAIRGLEKLEVTVLVSYEDILKQIEYAKSIVESIKFKDDLSKFRKELEEEENRLVSEKAKLDEEERIKKEEEDRLAEEQKRLDEEQKRLDEEEQKRLDDEEQDRLKEEQQTEEEHDKIINENNSESKYEEGSLNNNNSSADKEGQIKDDKTNNDDIIENKDATDDVNTVEDN